MIINNSSPEHHLLRKIYRHVDFSFIHELVNLNYSGFFIFRITKNFRINKINKYAGMAALVERNVQ